MKMEVKSQAQRLSLLHGLHSMKVTVSPLGIGPSNRTASSVYHLSYQGRHSTENLKCRPVQIKGRETMPVKVHNQLENNIVFVLSNIVCFY